MEAITPTPVRSGVGSMSGDLVDVAAPGEKGGRGT